MGGLRAAVATLALAIGGTAAIPSPAYAQDADLEAKMKQMATTADRIRRKADRKPARNFKINYEKLESYVKARKMLDEAEDLIDGDQLDRYLARVEVSLNRYTFNAYSVHIKNPDQFEKVYRLVRLYVNPSNLDSLRKHKFYKAEFDKPVKPAQPVPPVQPAVKPGDGKPPAVKPGDGKGPQNPPAAGDGRR